MSNSKLNCCKCGKDLGFSERIYNTGDLWCCEDCAIKEIQESYKKDQKITDLEAKLAEKEEELENYKLCRCVDCTTEYEKSLEKQIQELKQQLFGSGLKTLEEIKLSEQRKKMWEDLSTKNWKLEQQLEEKEKMHLLDENEFQRYCAYKHIEPQIKGCLDREREFEKKLAEKDKEIEVLNQRLKDTIKIYSDDFVEKDKELKELRFQARNIFPLVENLEDKLNQDKISFVISELEKVRKYVDGRTYLAQYIDNKIKTLKEGK